MVGTGFNRVKRQLNAVEHPKNMGKILRKKKLKNKRSTLPPSPKEPGFRVSNWMKINDLYRKTGIDDFDPIKCAKCNLQFDIAEHDRNREIKGYLVHKDCTRA